MRPGARINAGRLRTAEARSLLGDRKELVRLAAEKLKRWGITQAQVDEVLKTGKADSTVPILSPISGHVFKKNVVEGQEVPEATRCSRSPTCTRSGSRPRSTSTSWRSSTKGKRYEASVEAFPGQTFPGKVEFIQPHLDPSTRTVEVRYSLDNPGHRATARHVRDGDAQDAGLRLPAFRARLPRPSRRTFGPDD